MHQIAGAIEAFYDKAKRPLLILKENQDVIHVSSFKNGHAHIFTIQNRIQTSDSLDRPNRFFDVALSSVSEHSKTYSFSAKHGLAMKAQTTDQHRPNHSTLETEKHRKIGRSGKQKRLLGFCTSKATIPPSGCCSSRSTTQTTRRGQTTKHPRHEVMSRKWKCLRIRENILQTILQVSGSCKKNNEEGHCMEIDLCMNRSGGADPILGNNFETCWELY